MNRVLVILEYDQDEPVAIIEVPDYTMSSPDTIEPEDQVVTDKMFVKWYRNTTINTKDITDEEILTYPYYWYLDFVHSLDDLI